MNQPPLNPDGVLNAMDTLMAETDADARAAEWARKVTTRVLEGYLAVALPEVTSIEELDQLPVGSVVRGGEDDLVGEKIRFSPYLPHWCTIGEEVEADKRDLLPARVLYRPEGN